MKAKNNSLLLTAVLLLTASSVFAQKAVRYDLYVKDTLVNYAGKEKRAIAVNGQIPMPTLTFTEGDTAEIVVHNQLKEGTSLHWHGVFLPNKDDGVPYLTQPQISPGTTHTYRFPVIQNGTHWYHSHSGLQEQIGMYGNLVLLKKADDKTFRKGIDDLPTVPIVLSEWTNLNPNNVHRMLHNASDWSAIKKGATQSYAEAIRAGHFKTKIANEWKRMLAMDVSDVYYDKILMNGNASTDLKTVDGKTLKAGDKVRLRISNGGASSYFWLRYAGGKITVVANDGNDVEPVEVDRLIIAVSETYDVVVTIPEDGNAYEFMATTEDRTNSSSYFIGNGVKKLIAPLPKLKYFEGMKMMNDMMKMNGDLDDMGMKMSLNKMDMNVVMYPEITGEIEPKEGHSKHNMEDENRYNANALGKIKTLNYSMLSSPHNTELPKDAPVKKLNFTLTGNMNRYVWSMDNKVLSEVDKILVKKGEVLRITI
ncbi:MAG: copper oxidase, partial [Pedobacter sp.]